ncbi:MAG: methyltransferase domain-containing protein [Mycobacteriales bacterium]
MVRQRASTFTRNAVVWQALREVLRERDTGRPLDILDAGGGTGSFAVPLAELGHRVTVVDPSPDSLAALERRAAEAGVSAQVSWHQGDAAGLLDVVPEAAHDLVLCHSVLEVVEDPAAALTAVSAAPRPGAVISVIAAGRSAAVLARVLAGRFAEAAALLDDPAGRAGPTDPLLRRFELSELLSLLDAAGCQPKSVHGVQVFTDLLSGALLDSEPTAIAALEERVAEAPTFVTLAAALHVLAVRREASA